MDPAVPFLLCPSGQASEGTNFFGRRATGDGVEDRATTTRALGRATTKYFLAEAINGHQPPLSPAELVILLTEARDNILRPKVVKLFSDLELTSFSWRELTEQFLRGASVTIAAGS
jgi:hypothetical protein